MSTWAIQHGDALARLREMPDESVHCVVTSPPYWGLRDYGTATWEGGNAACDHVAGEGGHLAESATSTRGGANKVAAAQTVPFKGDCGKCGARRIDQQIGLEATPAEYVAKMVAVFAEVRRVLRDDGTCWVNLGSSYANFDKWGGESGGKNYTSAEGGFFRGRKGNTTAGGSGGTSPIRSRVDALAYGSDGTPLQGSPAADRACPCCGGELQDGSLIRRAHNARTFQRSEPVAPPLSRKARGSERSDSASTLPPASHGDAPPSTNRASFRRDRAACVPLATVSALPGVPATSGSCVPPSAGNSACTGGTTQTAHPSAFHTWGTGFFCTACGYCTTTFPTFKPKDMVPIPWMVAMALQADGWYLRQDIIWAKPNPMPESVTDRCTKAHEYLFLLTKSARYHYNAEAISEPMSGEPHAPGNKAGRNEGHLRNDFGTEAMPLVPQTLSTRNRRSVWTISTQAFPEAHFATFPEKLVEPCILAGCPAGGTVMDPFSGSGTTGVVAVMHGRRYIGIELNPEYAAMSEARINKALKPSTYRDMRGTEKAELFT